MKSLAVLTRLSPISRLHSLAQLVPLLAIGALTACDGSAIVFTDLPPPPPPPPVVYDEGEPNDAAWIAPWFGSLYPGESVRIAGCVTDDGSDPQDGLAFTAYGPCRIDFTLYVDDPWANLDVWLYEPELGLFTAAFDSPYHDEKGSIWFDAPSTDFHLVVFSAWGASPWRLVVESPYSGAAPLVMSSGANQDEPALRDEARSAEAGPGAPAKIPVLPHALRVYARGEDDDESLADPVLDAGALAWIEARSERLLGR